MRHIITKGLATVVLTLMAVLSPLKGAGQNAVALKTNLVADAALSPSFALEVGLGTKWSLEVGGSLCLWNWPGTSMRWRHAVLQPELRYWFCERFQGWFIAAHAIGGKANIGNIDTPMKLPGTDLATLKDGRYQGWGIGGGLGVGWAFPVAKHWSVELEAAGGFVSSKSERYEWTASSDRSDPGHRTLAEVGHHYWGPTKASVAIVYIF